MTKLAIRWFQLLRGNLTAILLVTVVLCALIFVSVTGAKFSPGFGPEWECTPMIHGDPVCTKKKPTDSNPAKSK